MLVIQGFSNEKPVQNEKQKLSVFTNVDFLSSHVWRGGKSGTLPSVEPLVELSKGNFTFGAWAAATFDGEYKELDLYAIYKVKSFSVGVFDYYCPPKDLSEARFTNVSKAETQHLYSVDVSFAGTKRIPVKLTASTMMYGMDFNSETGDYYFSTYLEALYSKSWKSNVVTATVGMTTHEGIYYEKAALVNTELAYKRKIELKHFSLPVFAKVIYNPATQKSFFVSGFSLSKGFKI